MRAIHLKDVHIPKSQNLFAFFVGEALWATIALFFLCAQHGRTPAGASPAAS
jgi:hypothetical protein